MERKSLRNPSSRGSYREGNLGNLTELLSLLVFTAALVVVAVVVVVVVVVVTVLEVVESSLKKADESVMIIERYFPPCPGLPRSHL